MRWNCASLPMKNFTKRKANVSQSIWMLPCWHSLIILLSKTSWAASIHIIIPNLGFRNVFGSRHSAISMLLWRPERYGTKFLFLCWYFLMRIFLIRFNRNRMLWWMLSNLSTTSMCRGILLIMQTELCSIVSLCWNIWNWERCLRSEVCTVVWARRIIHCIIKIYSYSRRVVPKWIKCPIWNVV